MLNSPKQALTVFADMKTFSVETNSLYFASKLIVILGRVLVYSYFHFTML